LATPQ